MFLISDIQKKQFKEQIESLTAKYSIYHMKIQEIEQQQAEENELAAKIDQVMPVKFNLENGKPEIAEAALAAASTELQTFYAEYDHNNRYEGKISQRFLLLLLHFNQWYFSDFNQQPIRQLVQRFGTVYTTFSPTFRTLFYGMA